MVWHWDGKIFDVIVLLADKRRWNPNKSVYDVDLRGTRSYSKINVYFRKYLEKNYKIVRTFDFRFHHHNTRWNNFFVLTYLRLTIKFTIWK